MGKKVLSICSIVTVILLLPVQEMIVSASTVNEVEDELNELEKEQKELDKKRGEVESEKGSTDEKLNENKEQQTVVEDEITVIDDELTTTIQSINEKETEIANIKNEITSLGDQITELDDDIDDLIERIKERDELLKKRLKSIQENGGPSRYIEVLFGSQSFSDFISRSSAVNKIMDQDIKIMDEQKEDKSSLETKLVQVKEKKDEVEEKKAEVELQKEELTTLKATLDEQLEEKEILMSELETEYEELDEYKLTLEEEQKIIQEQEASLAKAKEVAEKEKSRLEQLAKEEEERRKKAEAERKKREKEQQQARNKPANEPSTVVEPQPEPENVGTFIWPSTSRRVTSGYGQRVHPVTGQVGKMHHGIDLGIHRQPVYSSASGVVFSTSPKSGYGNTVLITHIIDGRTYTTLYAHLESVSVSPGQVVSQGDRIGTSGNTGGSSTGHHLHFEIHEGMWNGAKSNSRNPLNYLP